MFVKKDIDNSTCALYDIFSYVFTKLCSLKNDIVAIIPKNSQNDIHSIADDNEKTGLLIFMFLFLNSTAILKLLGQTFAIEQDGAVSRANVNILKGTSAISLREELVV